MPQAAYLVLNYAARYWFAALAVFIVWRAALNTVREYRIAQGIHRRIAKVATFAELVVVEDERGKIAPEASFPFAKDALLGSGGGCDIRLRHKDIARKHMRLRAEDDCVRVIPVKNVKVKILLDGQAVRGEALAFDGSELAIGGLRLRVKTREAFHD